ncbi:hypothetical protein EDEG_00945 [Edhazardia aedis USNM 41457]|uniref:SCA7 domain-containing protein n=1 Tax=Edhazardia aedis (strain USNM 41457) TaxID=1003232 RepID=J9DQN4_EDHAE|nr:hypothetical protein EDEG_00945 [Edhazardia aedis USNM 41457]|eukprot:EJW04875.1 hypothetical protein EDEG_00945 [Edhazardia aedis USNM 41457]
MDRKENFLKRSFLNTKLFINENYKKMYCKCKICEKIMPLNTLNSHFCFNLCSQSLAKRKKRNEENLDLEKHCGVDIVNDQTKEIVGKCKNGFTCKIHTLDEKRKVLGRMYSVDMLIRIINDDKIRKKKKSVFKVKKNEPAIEVDENTKTIIKDLKPVVTYRWYFPRYENDCMLFRSFFPQKNPRENKK